MASLKATRATQGAHEGSPSLVGSDRSVSGSHDDTLKVWRLADGSCEKTLQGHKRVRVFCVVVLPGGDRMVSCSCDNTLKIWRLADGSCEKTLQHHAGLVGVAGGKLAAEPRRALLPHALRKQRPVLGLVVAPAISITARQSLTNKGRPTHACLEVLKSQLLCLLPKSTSRREG